MDNPKVIEPLAAVIHEAWIGSTKGVVSYLKHEGFDEAAGRLTMAWSAQWVPYQNLREEEKERHRVWAREAVKTLQ